LAIIRKKTFLIYRGDFSGVNELSRVSNPFFYVLTGALRVITSVLMIKIQQGIRIYPQYPTVPYRTLPYRTVSYRTVSYRTVSYRIVPYRIVPYRTLPFSVRIFFTLAVSKREAYRFFCLKLTVFPLKKSKARTVPYLK
jgi:hypothetical protein